jgi:hypothetical protein
MVFKVEEKKNSESCGSAMTAYGSPNPINKKSSS